MGTGLDEESREAAPGTRTLAASQKTWLWWTQDGSQSRAGGRCGRPWVRLAFTEPRSAVCTGGGEPPVLWAPSYTRTPVRVRGP